MTYSSLAIDTRRALLDALVALRPHREALVLVGAQAIYLYTGDTDVAIATLTADGIPVELLVPAGLQPGSTRGARIPPHDRRAAKRVPGLEAAAFDFRPRMIEALEPDDHRREETNVAGPAALVIAKMHKIGERYDRAQAGGRDRTIDKNAHDLYRVLSAVEAAEVVSGLERLQALTPTAGTTSWAIAALRRLAIDPDAPLCRMAGRAERDVGDPEDVAVRTWGLVADILEALT